MNDPLIQRFIEQAALAPHGLRMQTFAALVAEHCATIVDIDPKWASHTIRAAFVPDGKVQLKPIAQAASTATH